MSDTIFQQMRDDLQYLSRLKKQIVVTEGADETEPGYDWDSMDADFDDRERTAEIMAAMAPIYEDESDSVYVPPREGYANV